MLAILIAVSLHAGFLHLIARASPPAAQPRSTSGHFNVTDRRNTPPEPQYTAVKIVSTQAQLCRGLVYIATFFIFIFQTFPHQIPGMY